MSRSSGGPGEWSVRRVPGDGLIVEIQNTMSKEGPLIKEKKNMLLRHGKKKKKRHESSREVKTCTKGIGRKTFGEASLTVGGNTKGTL